MRNISFTLLFMCFLVPRFVFAQDAPDDAALMKQGWHVLTFDQKLPNRFNQNVDKAIVVETDNSVSVLYKKVAVDLAQTPKLSWSWKVTDSIGPSDLEKKGQDDRPLALYVSFPFDEERASFWERFVRAFIVAIKGEDTPGRVLSYVWGSTQERGTVLESPYLKNAGALIVLRGTPDVGTTWHRETVDIAADYERIFGMPANQPFQIAISADSDDSKATSLGYVKDIGFTR